MKKQKLYSELMTNKNKTYFCYTCNSNNVKWDSNQFICSRCKAVHTSEGHNETK